MIFVSSLRRVEPMPSSLARVRVVHPRIFLPNTTCSYRCCANYLQSLQVPYSPTTESHDRRSGSGILVGHARAALPCAEPKAIRAELHLYGATGARGNLPAEQPAARIPPTPIAPRSTPAFRHRLKRRSSGIYGLLLVTRSKLYRWASTISASEDSPIVLACARAIFYKTVKFPLARAYSSLRPDSRVARGLRRLQRVPSSRPGGLSLACPLPAKLLELPVSVCRVEGGQMCPE